MDPKKKPCCSLNQLSVAVSDLSVYIIFNIYFDYSMYVCL